MRYYHHEGNPALSPLIATADYLRDSNFILKVMAADKVIGLSRHGQHTLVGRQDVPEGSTDQILTLNRNRTRAW